MCERRIRKIKKGSNLLRQREARRLERQNRRRAATLTSASLSVPSLAPQATDTPPQHGHSAVDENAQSSCRVIIELAWRTIALMHKNAVIQQKIVDLQKETREFVASVMSNPENKQKYIKYVCQHSKTLNETPQQQKPNSTVDDFAEMSLTLRPRILI